jgi:(p)ppGpp synthase/HD superfamily hydrolase
MAMITPLFFIRNLVVILSNEAGSLATLTNVIAKQKNNISNLKIVDRSSEFFEMVVYVGVKGESQLDNIIRSLLAKTFAPNYPLDIYICIFFCTYVKKIIV